MVNKMLALSVLAAMPLGAANRFVLVLTVLPVPAVIPVAVVATTSNSLLPEPTFS